MLAPNTATLAAQPEMESLGRGLVAVRTSSTQAYVGWRLLGTDAETTGFNLYRSIGGAAAVKLNASPLTTTTDYRDTPGSGAFASTISYFVRPVAGGVEQEASGVFTLPANVPTQQFLSVPLQIPAGGTTPDGVAYTYSANDAAPADLDGDGEYELVLKWEPSNAKDNSQAGYTGNVYLDAYKLNGVRLWRIDLGRNIRAGAHYTQFIAYDLDGDGRAEVACKTAPGTRDGLGAAVLLGSDGVDADYRNGSGYILTGPEYLTVFDGLTGAELATTAYLPGRGTVSNWGDSYGNRVDRFLAGVAYLDGNLPSLVMCRGYYTQSHLVAWDWRGGALTRRWTFSAANNTAYAGQGNHQLSVADVDDDGRQEIVYGAMVVNDDGTGLHTTGLGHADALHVSDFRPSRPGQEVFTPHESAASNGNVGTSFRDGRTGELIWTTYGSNDVGRAVMMDLDPRYPGGEAWATNNGNIYSAYGPVVAGKPSNMFHNFAVWWDADPQRELLDGVTVSDYKYTSGRSNYLVASGVASNNGTKSTPALSGDILGDWREEVVWRTTDSSALRIYTTTIPAVDRRTTFLHDPQYRAALAWQNVAYNQPPHPGFDVASVPAFWNGASPATWSADGANWSRSTPSATPAALRAGDTAVLRPASALSLSLSGAPSPTNLIVESAAEVTISGPGTLAGAGTWNHAGPGLLRWSASGSFSTWANVFDGSCVFSSAGLLTTPRLQVHAGAALGGAGRVAGTLELADGSGLLLDSSGAFQVTGPVVATGTITVSAAPGQTITPGTYPVLAYTGTFTGTPTFAWSGAGLSAVFDTSAAGTVRVTLTESAVVGADVLSWTGTAGAAWDFAASNWLGLGGVTVYEDGDTVRFEAAPSTRAITLAAPVAPASVVFDSEANWTLSGAGSITGNTTLLKRGSGTAAIGTANSFNGGTRIEEGTLAASNPGALGASAVTIAGGTLATGTLTIPNAIIVDGAARITGGDGGGSHGIKGVSGSGVLTLEASSVFDLEGSFATFTGRVLFSGSGSFRFFGGAGSSFADFELGTRSLGARSGSAFALGSLSGLAGSALNGASGSGNNAAVTYTIGANNHDTAFLGAINNGNAATLVVKTGSGRLTLAGSSTYTGNTTVSAGTLAVTGSLGATAVSVSSGAALAGTGSLGGSLALAPGASLATPPGEDALTVAGAVTLSGPVAVVPEGGEFETGTHLVLRHQGALTGGGHWSWTPPEGSNLQGAFDLSTPGEVRLVVTRVLTALEQWRLAQLGTADAVGAASDAADPDEDGLVNLLEYALGGDPLSSDAAEVMPRPVIAAGKLTLEFTRAGDPALVYEVEATSDLQAGEWSVIWSSTGAGNVAGAVTVSDSAELANEPRRFLRLVVR